MRVLILGDREVRELLPLESCMEAMADALRAMALGDAVQPLRSMLAPPGDRGLLGLMPAYVGRPPTLGIKVLTLFPGNSESPYPSHQGGVLIFDCDFGRPLAIVDAASLTEIRTAAVSALATRALALESASRLAILGTGAQAEAHAHAMIRVRSIRSIRIWGRRPERARSLIERLRATTDPSLDIDGSASPEEAVREADLVCTTTGARAPILEGAWVRPGAHINAVGAAVPGYRELDADAVARSRLYVDRRASAEAEADEYRIPLREGIFSADHIIGELGDLLLGRIPGRRNASEVTLFKSVGMAVEDVAAARRVYDRAAFDHRGTEVELSADRAAGSEASP